MSLQVKVENSPPTAQPLREDDDICELEHLRKLFIGGLAPYTTEESLKDFYGQFGKVVDVVVMRDPQSKRSRGFGFVTYTKSSMVDKAQENRPHIVDKKSVEAKRALPRPDRESRESNLSVKKLFVGGLKDNHDEQCLEDYFSQFGTVISVKILTDKTTSKRRGFAFIEFDDYDSVDKAILKKTHSIKYVLVDVKKSIYKHESRNGNNTGGPTSRPQQQQPEPPTQIKPILGGQNGYRGPMQQVPPPGMPSYPHQGPMNGGGPPPPPPAVANYNYWGPPPPGMQPPYGGYAAPQPQPPMHNWNYAPNQQQWNAGPPPAAANWYPPNQWGGPPVANGPPPVAPVAPCVASPVANWAVPPQVNQVQPVPAPVANVAPPLAMPIQQQPPPQQQHQPNFGTGYQQSYSGGPAKSNLNQNRMNPYGQQSTANTYINSGPPGTNSYGGYNAGGVNGKQSTVQNSNNVSISAGGGNSKYRR